MIEWEEGEYPYLPEVVEVLYGSIEDRSEFEENVRRILYRLWQEAYNWGMATEGSGGDVESNPYNR